MGYRSHGLAAHLEAAASALEFPLSSADGSADLLRYLGYDDGAARRTDNRAKMLRAGARLRRLFLLPVPDAPGLVFFGGEADPAVLGEPSQGLPATGLAGSGLSPQKAFESCVGEGIEYLSQFVQAGDPVERGPCTAYGESADEPVREFLSGLLAHAGIPPDNAIAWVPSTGLMDGVRMWFPLDICYRRRASQQDFKPPLKLSSGCAAGATREEATLRGLLELVERDAVALWWRGGRRAKAVAAEATSAAVALLAQARQGQGQRNSWLLDITTDVGIPVAAAISTDPDGTGFAVGFGSRLALADAARAAVFELLQVELGLHVIAAKRRESGDVAMNESDRRQLRRSLFDKNTCALLQPQDGGGPEPRAVSGLAEALERLKTRGIAAYAIELTRPQFGVPVVRVLAPALQLEPCEITSTRLARAIAETGGGAQYHGGLPLM